MSGAAAAADPARPYRLLGAPVSYYTAKARAFLLQKRLPFTDVLATRAVFREEILPRVGWPVIPVMITPADETVQDTSDMVDLLEIRHPDPPLVPRTPLRRFAALLFELYADEWIKVPALHYRWNHDRDFAVMEFGRNNDPDRSPEEQRKIGEKIAAPFAAWLPPLGVSVTTIAAIEADYLALLAAFEEHFAIHPFLFGATPTLADCALFGPFHAHLYRDPNSGVVMRRHAPRVVAWLDRLQAPADIPNTPEPDVLPVSLLPVWQLLSRDYVPILTAQVAALQDWLASRDDAEIPRTLGSHDVEFGRGQPWAVRAPRALFTYDQWMLQRALDAYAAAGPDARSAIASFARAIGAEPLLQLRLTHRLERRGFRLVRGSAPP